MWSVGVAELTQKEDFNAGSAFENGEILFNYLSRATRQQGCLSGKLEEHPKAFSMEVEVNIYPHRYANNGVLADSLTLSNTHAPTQKVLSPNCCPPDARGIASHRFQRRNLHWRPIHLGRYQIGENCQSCDKLRKEESGEEQPLSHWLALGGLFLAFPGLNSP